MKKILLSLTVLLSSTSYAAVEYSALPDLKNKFIYDNGLVSSGFPELSHYEQIKAAGIDAVVNVIPNNSVNDQKNGRIVNPADVRAQGLAFYNVPFEFDAPIDTVEHFVAVMDHLKANSQEVLVNCAVNWRASILVYTYNAIKTGKANPKDLTALGDIEKLYRDAPHFEKFVQKVTEHYKL